MHTIKTPNPWYREPWPWILMSGPALVVVAGMVTLSLAVSGHDGLVVDDYYKEGKEVNRSLKRDDVARALALSATISIDERHDRVTVALRSAKAEVVVAAAARLMLIHATSVGLDQVVTLRADGEALVGDLLPLAPGKWNLLLEDQSRQWRLQQSVMVGRGPLATLELRAPQPP